MLDDEEIDFNDTPISITINIEGLNLNDEQLSRLVGFILDEDVGEYLQIPGILSDDGSIFTFEISSNSIIGIMLAETNLLRQEETPTPMTVHQNIIRLVIDYPIYTVNDTIRTSDVAPFIDPEYSRTMVPLRLVGEALGAEVYWMGDIRQVLIIHGTVILRLPIDQPLPDGMGTPVIVNGRTLVPIAYVAQMLGASTHWDGENRAVYIWQ